MAAERDVLDAVHEEFAGLKALAERAAAQLDDEAFFAVLDADANSVALLMKHVGGNLRSRWTEPFTTDGEKADRQRDLEFEREARDARDTIARRWDAGWMALFATLGGASDADLARTLRIRDVEYTFARALARSLAHTAGHVHQIVLLAKHWRGSRWETLSLARRPPDAGPGETR